VIPFRVSFEPGVSLFEQVVYAAKKALISAQIQPGEKFPSVRALSQALKINPNTAHKVVNQLVAEGLLAVYPGVGTVAARRQQSTARERAQLLSRELEELVVEAMKLHMELDDVVRALEDHWRRLKPAQEER
jgi:GntR family transcriptional regulator